MTRVDDILPQPGQRALIVGMTGSGKTSLACTLLQRLSDVPVIYDTKIEPKFLQLSRAVQVHSPGELFDRYHDNINVNDDGEESTIHDYFVVVPDANELRDPQAMDERWLLHHYEHLQGVPAYVDEIVQWHARATPGDGLLNLLQRGRSKGITLIMSTQRPRFISRSCFSEADLHYDLFLLDRDDRRRVAEIVPDFDIEQPVPKYYFRHYRAGDEHSTLFSPLPLDKSLDNGYTDREQAQSVPDVYIDWL